MLAGHSTLHPIPAGITYSLQQRRRAVLATQHPGTGPHPGRIYLRTVAAKEGSV